LATIAMDEQGTPLNGTEAQECFAHHYSKKFFLNTLPVQKQFHKKNMSGKLKNTIQAIRLIDYCMRTYNPAKKDEWRLRSYKENLPSTWKSMATGKACSANALPDRPYKFAPDLRDAIEGRWKGFQLAHVLPFIQQWLNGKR